MYNAKESALNGIESSDERADCGALFEADVERLAAFISP
jgi:hypothetical protein